MLPNGDKCYSCNPDVNPSKKENESKFCQICRGTGKDSKGNDCYNCDTEYNIEDYTNTNHPDVPTDNPGTVKEDRDQKYTTGSIIDGSEQFIEVGQEDAGNKIKEENLQTLSNNIYNILLVVGIIIALIVGLILGIKFILGSLEEKAEIKTMIVPYIIGCVVVFGAFTIWQIIVDLLQSV